MKEKNNYINSEEFSHAFVEYKKEIVRCLSEGLPKPQIPNYICECFIKIATNLARSGLYSSYTWKDEMISDAIENQLQYCHNFDPSKSENAFGYFTQICVYAFWRRIAKEKKQLYLKYKMAEKYDMIDSEELKDLDIDPSEFGLYENNYEFIEQYEQSMNKKKDKVSSKKPKGLELFLED